MARTNDKQGSFDAIRARATQMRIDSLQARLNSVSLLCEIAGNANASIAAEALARAQSVFEQICQEVNGSPAVSNQGPGELMRRTAEVEAQLARATQRLCMTRDKEQEQDDRNHSGEELAS